MIRRAIALAIIVVSVTACDDPPPGSRVASARQQADSLIYAQLLDSLRGARDSVLVGRAFSAFPESVAEAPALAAWVHKQAPAIDSALVVALADAQYGGSVAVTLGQPRGVHWLDDYREAGGAERFGRSRVVWFTRVAYDASRTHAVVYASMGCGGLCGNGSFYAFELRNATWREIGRVIHVIS